MRELHIGCAAPFCLFCYLMSPLLLLAFFFSGTTGSGLPSCYLCGLFAVTNFSHVCAEKVHGVHQLQAPAGDEEWEIRPGLQTVPEDDPPGKSQAGHPGQQLPCSQVCEEDECIYSVSVVFIQACKS